VLFTEANLKNFRITKNGNFIKNNHTFYYHYACVECGYPHLNTRIDALYCTHECMGKSESFKLQMSIKCKTIQHKPFTDEHKNNISKCRMGIIFTDEHKNNISKAQMREKNHFWKGGITYNPYCIVWSDREWKHYLKYTRDGGKCWSPYCNGNHLDKLTLHHINYNKKDCDSDNLITLCTSCNSRANKDREWHEVWYTLLMKKRRY
jgi:hypothetical protein